jgi:hypothetical protein
LFAKDDAVIAKDEFFSTNFFLRWVPKNKHTNQLERFGSTKQKQPIMAYFHLTIEFQFDKFITQ